ncbi:MAG TPA: metal-sulfur cluster assembly factor [Gemmatimonadales bacterium]|nr:metal-sulfur cluster assembly factor [Gemmatimonadales bacterium]
MPTPDDIRKALRQVKDPEIGLSVIDLGLVYDVQVDEQGIVDVTMTLTSPGCPSGPEIMADVDRVARSLEGVTGVNVDLVWEPYWTPERIDPKVRAFLGY